MLSAGDEPEVPGGEGRCDGGWQRVPLPQAQRGARHGEGTEHADHAI